MKCLEIWLVHQVITKRINDRAPNDKRVKKTSLPAEVTR